MYWFLLGKPKSIILYVLPIVDLCNILQLLQNAASLLTRKSNPATDQAISPIRQMLITPKIKVPLLTHCGDFASPVIVVIHRLHSSLELLITLLS